MSPFTALFSLEALPFAEPSLPEEDLEELDHLECDGNVHGMM